jgi:general secretion pathway protein G
MNDPMKNPSSNCENSVNDFACSKRFNRKACNKGFTLIEVCIVLAIIGTLSAIAVPNYLKYKNNAKIMVAVTDIRLIEKQISFFLVDNPQLPNNLNIVPNIPTNDPWGNPYRYLRIDGVPNKAAVMGFARRNMMDAPVNEDYDLYSMGKDGATNKSFKVPVAKDDVVRAYEGRYVGLVSEL